MYIPNSHAHSHSHVDVGVDPDSFLASEAIGEDSDAVASRGNRGMRRTAY